MATEENKRGNSMSKSQKYRPIKAKNKHCATERKNINIEAKDMVFTV